MASTEKPMITYEEERQRIIEENKRRMQELGLPGTLAALRMTKNSQSTPKKTTNQRLSVHLEDLCVETRRSSRAANRPKVDYKEAGMDVGLRRTRGVRRPLRRGYVSTVAKNEAAARANDIKTAHPSFVKAMLKSHTSGGFWLGLPCVFCYTHFTKDDLIILEDEEGLEWECVYLHHKHGLSGGWRGFSLDHNLEDGDAVVFELVTKTRFKVHITRASVSGEASAQEITVAKRKSYQYAVKDLGNVHVHSAVHKALKKDHGGQFRMPAREASTHSMPAKTVERRMRKSNYDWNSDENQELKEEHVSEGESQSEDVNIQEYYKKESKQKYDDGIQPAINLKKKICEMTKRLVKSNQQLKIKASTSSRDIASQGMGESSKALMKVVKKETFVRRAERKSDVQMVRKEIAAREIEQKRNLPPGTRLKPVGVCSIARGSVKRKLPALFPARKYSFFSGTKSVKVQ